MQNNLKIEFNNKSKENLKNLISSFEEFWKIRAKAEGLEIINNDKFILDIQKVINNEDNLFFTIKNKEDNKILGFLIFSIQENNIPYFQNNNKYLYINYLYISSTLQWQWYSTKLFNKIKEFCKKKEINTIKLNVSNNNKKAIQIYEKWGFNIVYHNMEYTIT